MRVPSVMVDAVTEVKVAVAGKISYMLPTVQIPLEVIITCPFVLPLADG